MPQEAACGGREVTAGATRPPESSSAGSTASGGQRGLRLGEGRQETEGASQGTTQHLEVTVGGGCSWNLALQRLRQEDYFKFEAGLSYTGRPCLSCGPPVHLMMWVELGTSRPGEKAR